MTDPAAGLSVLHVVVRAGPTNSQYNEHCLPVARSRRVTVCSLFPADVEPPPEITLYDGDGTVRGCFAALRRAFLADRYDVVHVHAAASAMVVLLTCLRMRRSLRNLLLTVHNSWGNFSRRNRLFLRAAIALFPLVVVCGHAAYESLPARVRRLYGGKLTVVPNGVDVDRVHRALRASNLADGPADGIADSTADGIADSTADGIDSTADGIADCIADRRRPGGRTVVSANRLIPLKDPLTLLDAFLSVQGPGDRLVLLGDGPLGPEVERRAAAAGVEDQVELTGIVPRDEVYARFAEADVFVSTSHGEGLPVALLEAMASGVPVVATDIPPHREVARLAGGLTLVPPGDARQFARAITDVSALDPVERDLLVERQRRCVAEHYTVRGMNESYGQIYRRLVEVDQAPRTATAASLPSGNVEGLLLAKLRQRASLLVFLTLAGGVIGFVVASIQSPVYKGETTLQVGRTLGVGVDEDTMKTSTSLAVRYTDMVRRETVLGPVAEAGYASSWKHLQGDVFAQLGDKNPQLVQISVYAGDEEEAGQLAAAVGESLQQAATRALASDQNKFFRNQLAAVQSEIAATSSQLRRSREDLAEAPPEERTEVRERIQGLESTLQEQRRTFAELSPLDTASVGSLTLVDRAWTTRSPLRPAPLVLGLTGAAIGATIAAAWAHLFGRPRVGAHARAAHAAPQWTPSQPESNGHARPTALAAPDRLR